MLQGFANVFRSLPDWRFLIARYALQAGLQNIAQSDLRAGVGVEIVGRTLLFQSDKRCQQWRLNNDMCPRPEKWRPLDLVA